MNPTLWKMEDTGFRSTRKRGAGDHKWRRSFVTEHKTAPISLNSLSNSFTEMVSMGWAATPQSKAASSERGQLFADGILRPRGAVLARGHVALAVVAVVEAVVTDAA